MWVIESFTGGLREFATAAQYDAPLIVNIVETSQYGTSRMHQERDYPGRVIGTQLKNPDFATYANAFGGHGERVERNEEFAPGFELAHAFGKSVSRPSSTASSIRTRSRLVRILCQR